MENIKKRYGITFVDKRNIIFHFGIRFFEVWITHKDRRKHFGLFNYRYPEVEQCIYSLSNREFKMSVFLGVILY